MEAKDTVISDERLVELAQVPPEDYGAPPHWWLRANRRVAKAQAEISFQAGKQEVVDWIRQHTHKVSPNMYGNSLPFFAVVTKEWQEFSKSEGIE